MAADLGEARGKIILDADMSGLDKAEKGLDQFGKKATESGKSVKDVQPILRETSTGALVAGGIIAAGFAVAVKAASDFEFRMSAIQAVSGATAAEMDLINDAALRIGKDTSFSASEAASAMEELVKAGISVKDTLGGAADATVALAAAGGVDLPVAATIAANAMNQFNLAAKDLVGVTDTIAGAANASAIDMEQFAYSLSQVGAVANLAGLSFDDTALAIAAMGNAGIVGSDAGTSLKQVLLNLIPSTNKQIAAFENLGLITMDAAKAQEFLRSKGIKPLGKDQDTLTGQLKDYAMELVGATSFTTEAQTAFQKLGYETQSFSNAFYDANGQLRSLAEISDVLGGALEGMTDQQKQSTLEVLFGSDAIRGAAIIAKEGSEGFNELAEAIGKTSAAEVAATRMNNFQGSVEQLKGSLETLMITIGQALLPILNEMVKGFTAALDVFIGLPGWVQGVAVGFFGLVGALLLTYGVVAKGVTTFLAIRDAMLLATGATTLYGNAGALAATKVKIMAAAQWVLNAAMRANPILLVVSIVAALIAAYVLLAKKGDILKKAFAPVFKSMQAAAKKFAPTLEQIGELFGNLVDKVGTALVPVLDSIVKILGAVLTPVVGILAGVLGALAKVVGAVLVPVLVILQPILDLITWVLGLVAAAVSFLGDVINNVFGFIGSVIDQAGKAFGDWYSKHIQPTVDKALAALQPMIDWFRANFEKGLSIIVERGAAAFERFRTVVAAIWERIREKAEPVVNWFKTEVFPKIDTAIKTTQDFFNKLRDSVATAWEALKARVEPVFLWMRDTLFKTIQDRAKEIRDDFNDFRDTAASAWEGLKTRLETFLSWWNETFVPAIAPKLDNIRDRMTTLKDKFAEAWDKIKERVEPIIAKFRDEILPALTSAIEKVRDKIVELKDKFTEAWDKMKEKLEPITTRIQELVTKIQEAFAKFFDKPAGEAAGDKPETKAVSSFDRLMKGIDAVLFGIEFALAFITNIISIIIMVFDNMANAIGFAMRSAQLSVQTAAGIIRGILTGDFSTIPAPVRAIFDRVRAAIGEPIEAAIAIFQGIRGRIMAAFSGAGNWLLEIGKTIIGGLMRGIDAALGGLKNLLTNVTKMIPENKGPESVDKKLLEPAGEMIMMGLMSGMQSQFGNLFGMLGGLNVTIPATLEGMAMAGVGGGNTTKNNTLNYNNYSNASGYQSDEELQKAMRRGRTVPSW